MRHLQIRNIILIFALSLIGFACGDSSTDPGTSPSTVEGRVEDNNGDSSSKIPGDGTSATPVEGAVVTAARVNANGSLEVIDGAETQTNAQGEFSLSIDMDVVANAGANASERIIIVAEKDSRQWRAFVSSRLESGGSYTVQPLNAESSGKAEVYQRIVAQGRTDLVTKADIESYIRGNVAAEANASSSTALALGNALVAEAEARAKFFVDSGIDISQQMQAQIVSAKTQAHAELETRLDAAQSETERAEVFDLFVQAVTNVHVEAGVQASAYAKAKELAAQVFINHSTEVSAEIQSELRTYVALITAYAIDKGVQARMEAENAAQQSIDAAVQAGVELRGEIKAKSSATKEEITTLFDAYNQAIVNVLSQEFTANSQTMVDINAEINENNGAKATLESSIVATLNTNTIVSAYSTFYSSVRSIVDSTFTTATEAEAEFVTDVMILINVAT